MYCRFAVTVGSAQCQLSQANRCREQAGPADFLILFFVNTKIYTNLKILSAKFASVPQVASRRFSV